MKAIILAAGKGTRLRPFTDSVPKCMVKYNEKEILSYILSTMDLCNIDNIGIVAGYKKDVLQKFLQDRSIEFFTNESFATTNMVATLFSAESFMDDDLIISYSDIIYTKEVLQKLVNSTADFSVVVDKNWRQLWEMRMDNPLSDAETLKINNGSIVELGKKAYSYDDIEGQYIGLMKISAKKLNEFKKYYHSLSRNDFYDGKDYDNMYMTSLIQKIIDDVMDVTPVIIQSGWIEIDSVQDLNAYTNKGLKF